MSASAWYLYVVLLPLSHRMVISFSLRTNVPVEVTCLPSAKFSTSFTVFPLKDRILLAPPLSQRYFPFGPLLPHAHSAKTKVSASNKAITLFTSLTSLSFLFLRAFFGKIKSAQPKPRAEKRRAPFVATQTSVIHTKRMPKWRVRFYQEIKTHSQCVEEYEVCVASLSYHIVKQKTIVSMITPVQEKDKKTERR